VGGCRQALSGVHTYNANFTVLWDNSNPVTPMLSNFCNIIFTRLQ
jgi:hypothetical protein